MPRRPPGPRSPPDRPMKPPRTVPIDDCIGRLADYDAILDARSPSEFAIDHLPGATSTPVLDDRARAEDGPLHARAGAVVARRRGAALAARRLGEPPETRVARPRRQ